jgi:uncharacterized protein
MTNDPKAILTAANDAIQRGDIEGFLRFCTEDTVWDFIGDRTLRGKRAVREWMMEAYKEPPVFQVHRLIGDDGSVAAIGKIMLAGDTGATKAHAYCDIWQVRDGKLAELQAFLIQPN